MMLGGINFLIGTVLVASAYDTVQLVIGRCVLGLGVGFATQVSAVAWRAAALQLHRAWLQPLQRSTALHTTCWHVERTAGG
jgi:hypothetical protein